MRRGSTPTHIFNISLDTNLISKVRILYAQNDRVVLRKEDADCTREGQKIIVKLTQRETLLFKQGKVEVQLRVITPSGDSIPSKVYTVNVQRLLENEVFE